MKFFFHYFDECIVKANSQVLFMSGFELLSVKCHDLV